MTSEALAKLDASIEEMWMPLSIKGKVTKLLNQATKEEDAELSKLYDDFIDKEIDTQFDGEGNCIAVYKLDDWNELTNRLVVLAGRPDEVVTEELPA